jgi:hypothetical protein
LLPISTAVVTSRTPSSPIKAAPITAKRRDGSSRRGYYRAQFESAWARCCAVAKRDRRARKGGNATPVRESVVDVRIFLRVRQADRRR